MTSLTRKRTLDPDDYARLPPRHARSSPPRSRSARAPRRDAARYRQSTLTQIMPGVSLLSRGLAAEESEDEEPTPRPVKRRRRRIGPSQKTLTQIGWINRHVIPSDDEEQEEEGFESEVLPSDDDEYDEIVAGEQNEEDEAEEACYGFSDDEEDVQRGKLPGANLDGAKDSPQTPRRPRPHEIPSSQTPPVTPLTPLSVLRKREKLNQRSPLKAVSTNGDQELLIQKQDHAKMPPPKLPTPVKGRRARVAFDSNVVSVAPNFFSERSHVSDSQDVSDEEELEMTSLKSVVIGQDTQAMIHQIDAVCGPNPLLQNTPSRNAATPEVESRSPSPSQANRSFNFDEEDDANAAPSPAPARSSPVLSAVQGEDGRCMDDDQEAFIEQGATADGKAKQDDEDPAEDKEEFPTSSFPIPRVPPPTQAAPRHLSTQESYTSQSFALQHPSQVSTCAETTQATPPRRPMSTQRGMASSQKKQRTGNSPRDDFGNVNGMSRGIGASSQASTTDDPIQSQTPKAQRRDWSQQEQQQQQQFDRVPESPLGNKTSSTKTSKAHDQRRAHSPRPSASSPTTSPTHAPSSSLPPSPPAPLTSSPTSPHAPSPPHPPRTTVNRRQQRRRLELSSDGDSADHDDGDGSAGVWKARGVAGPLFDGTVVSATQMLPESLMNYSLPLPPAGWGESEERAWVASSMAENEGEKRGE